MFTGTIGTTCYKRQGIVFKGTGRSYLMMETGEICYLFMVD